ncbi:MAG TPA: class I SAM-dependent methyltransferase, partial [Nevskiaceae bacterium]|nr:class I SAM-dependent methyltransferase [Nevskiaceae bacterium]
MSRAFLFSEALGNYFSRVGVREPPLFTQLREETAKLPMARMQIAPEEGQFLDLLLMMLQPTRCIEVGVFTGYSSMITALALPDDGRLLACDVNEEWTDIAQRYWKQAGVRSRIDLRIAPALETLDEELAAGNAGSYDFAFIDADKENYVGYYERCLKLIRSGGLIAVDNTLWSGRVADESVNDKDTVAIRAFNEHVVKDQRVDMCL